jgi:phosphatidylglycerol:prolipoprotein diacylglycerol transferase
MYVHNLNPFALQFTDTFGIRWYGLAYLAGFLCSYFTAELLIRRGRMLLPLVKVADLITYGAIGTLVGGRIGYCLFYAPDLITDFSNEFPFWGVLRVHKGGMASHGGIAGIALAVWIFCRQNKLSYLHILDLCGASGGLGILFGRIANFINGELYGREAPVNLSWAVRFPQEMYTWGADQIGKLELLGPAAQALGKVTIQGHTETLSPALWAQWVQNYRADSIARFSVETVVEKLIFAVQNGNEAVRMALAPVLTPRYPSQLIQALLEGFLVFVVTVIVWWRPKKPGVVGASFGLAYAIARIVGEQYRMPDAQIGFQALGLTRGQWLSIAMLVIAIAFLLWAQLRKAPRVGGLFPDRKPQNF